MDPQVSGSFIPHSPLVETRRRTPGMGLLLLLSIILFVVSVLGAAGVFAYEGILSSTIANQDDQLNKAEGAFEPDVINDLSRLDSRLINARSLLGAHLAPSAIFDFLSQVTLEHVQFTEFQYQLGASRGATITLSGVADSFSTVALQSDKFGAARMLKNVVFSNVAVGVSGKVTFDVAAELDPSLFIYARQPQTGVPTEQDTSSAGTSSDSTDTGTVPPDTIQTP